MEELREFLNSIKELNEMRVNKIQMVLDLLEDDNSYMRVNWPDTQEYMEKSWFNSEAVLDINSPSAYFIPLKRLL